jgi:hypothetical protein
MNFKDYLDSRQLYRITGTPENFLTAARYKLWGLNENNFKFYQTINPGDFIFFHSQRESQFFRNPASKIVGFGVVGNEFWVDDNKLWINSDTAGTNYPYRFSLSYVALFADISFDDTWDSTNFKFHSQTVAVLQNLLNSGFEPHKLFPKMGSFSQIKNSKAIEHLIDQTLLRETYYGYVEESGIDKFKSSPITEIRTENDVLRYSSPIVAIDQIKGHVFTRTGSSLYTKDTAKLRDANEIHQQILISLKKFFDDKQYKLYNNNHMDMLAFNKDKTVSYLIEAITFRKPEKGSFSYLNTTILTFRILS